MKFIVKIMLIIFIAFLSTPTIVSLIEDKADTSYFYSTAEEEQPHKDFKAEFVFYNPIEVVFFSNPTSSLILSKNLLKHDNLSASIFIPPPEQV